jgi:hypothetical protein
MLMLQPRGLTFLWAFLLYIEVKYSQLKDMAFCDKISIE